MVLSVEDVTLEFEGLRALSDVSFGVDAASLTALVGPNGAGKTSLLNCMGGFYTPTRGRVRFGGAVLSGLPPHRVAAAGVARVFQFVELFRHMTVLDNILLGRHRHMRAGVLAGSLFWGRRAARRRASAGAPRRSSSSSSSSAIARSPSPGCRSGCRSSSASVARSPWSRGCSCSTSRRPA